MTEQAWRELAALVAPERGDMLRRWRDRWIDEAHVVEAFDVFWRQQLAPEVRERADAHLISGMATKIVKALLDRPGAMSVTQSEEPVGNWTDTRMILCVVRAEPKP